MSTGLSGERCNVNALWFKVMRTPISPTEIEPVKMLCFLCVVFLWDVISLSLSRISNFKRSWKFVMRVSSCLYDLYITWSLKYNIEDPAKQNFQYSKFNNNTVPDWRVRIPAGGASGWPPFLRWWLESRATSDVRTASDSPEWRLFRLTEGKPEKSVVAKNILAVKSFITLAPEKAISVQKSLALFQGPML